MLKFVFFLNGFGIPFQPVHLQMEHLPWQAQMQRDQLIAILLSPMEDSDAMLQLDVRLGFGM